MPWRDGDALFKSNQIKPSPTAPRLYVWCVGDEVPNQVPFQVPHLPAPAALFPAPPRKRPRTLIQRALARSGERSGRIRLIGAADHFTCLYERAHGAGLPGMRWSGEPIGDGGGFVSRPPTGFSGVIARRKLERLTKALGPQTHAILTRALIGEVSAASLAKALGVSHGRAVAKLHIALCTLADVLDGRVTR